MTTAVWTASIKDDVSATSSKMSFSLKALDTTASDLFKKSHGNFKKFETDLKKAGVDTVDARLVTEKYRRELVETRKELLGLGKAATTTSRSMKEIATGALRSIGERALNVPGMLVSGAVGAVTTIGEKVFDVGKSLVDSVIEAAQFKQNAITGLEYMLGTRKEAEQIFADAQKLAQDTPLDTDKVITGIKQLVTAGFSGKDSMMLFKAVADQAAKFQDDEGMQDKVIAAFSRVQGRGVATAEDLESFRVAGFRAKGIVEELRGKKNLAPLFKGIKKDASEEDVIKQVKTVLGKGQIGSTTFLNAAIASLEKGKGNIGSFAGEMGAKSLTGTISNFKSAFKDLLKSTNVQEWKGIQQFQDFLTRITKALQGDAGKELLKTIEKIFNAIMSGLDQIKDDDIKGFVQTIANVGERAVNVIKEAWSWLDRLLKGGDIGDDLGDVLFDVAKYIGAGIKEGVLSAGSILEDYNKRFVNKYGVRKSTVEAKATEMGVSSKEFLNMYGAAERRFKEAGMADTVFKQKGETTGEAYFRRVLEFNSAMTQQQRANETFDVGSASVGKYGTMYQVGKDAAAGMELGARTELDSHSPSRTMARVGEDAAKGLVMGTEKGVSAVPGGRGIGTVNIAVNVGSMSGMGDPTQAANTIADITVERVVMALLERKAAEG